MFILSSLKHLTSKLVNAVRSPGGAVIFVKSSAEPKPQKITLVPGSHVFGGSHGCDYVLPGLTQGSAFTLRINPDLEASVEDPRGPLAAGFEERFTPRPHGGFLLDLGAASLLVPGRRPSLAAAVRKPATVFVTGLALLAVGVAAGPTAFGWQGPGSRAATPVRTAHGMQPHAPGSAVLPWEAFARSANDQLASLGSALIASGEAGTVRVSGSASSSEWSAAQDLLEGKARKAGVALILDQPRAAAPEIKSAPAVPPSLQVVAVMERPTPTVVVKGGARLRAGSQLADGWLVESISLRKVNLRRGSERHSVEF